MAVIRFAILSDTHFFAPGAVAQDGLWWNRVLQTRAAEVGASLVQALRALAPDFIIHCGDLTGHCDPANFELACQIMDQAGCPWYAVPGNHDTWFPGVRAALAARAGLAGEDCYFRRDLAGLRFLFLDVAYWVDRQGRTARYLDKDRYDRGEIAGLGPGPDELRWLEAELAEAADRPVILVSHAPLDFKPLYPVATLPRGQAPRGSATSLVDLMGDVARRAELRALIARYPQVKLALAGHWHIHDVTRVDGLAFVQTAALREYPFEFRIATLTPGRLSLTTHGLPEARFRDLSYMPEWRNDWVAGRPEDRDLEIALT